jgi:hypothetical protein
MHRSNLIVAPIIVVVAIGWYLFRPELLFINRTVNEALPPAAVTASMNKTTQPVPLSQGRFHSIAHETTGVGAVHLLADGKRIVRLSDFKTSNGPDVRV